MDEVILDRIKALRPIQSLESDGDSFIVEFKPYVMQTLDTKRIIPSFKVLVLMDGSDHPVRFYGGTRHPSSTLGEGGAMLCLGGAHKPIQDIIDRNDPLAPFAIVMLLIGWATQAPQGGGRLFDYETTTRQPVGWIE